MMGRRTEGGRGAHLSNRALHRSSVSKIFLEAGAIEAEDEIVGSGFTLLHWEQGERPPWTDWRGAWAAAGEGGKKRRRRRRKAETRGLTFVVHALLRWC